MKWLWFVGPVTALFVYLLVSLRVPERERRRLGELERWLEELIGPLAGRKGRRSRRVRLPPAMDGVIAEVGGGARVADIVLVPKQAYLAVRGSSAGASSAHQTVVLRLPKPAPTMTVRPLPELGGARADNRGIVFAKDPLFSDYFMVEGHDAKGIKRWLQREVRQALLDLPDVWLRTQGAFATVTLYGEDVDAETFDELVSVADGVFAARGPRGAASLFGDEEAPRRRQRDRSQRSQDEPAALGAIAKAAALDLALYGLAAVVLVAVLGRLPGFRPEWMFNSELVEAPEPWQGGWTTKGFGALVFAEALLVGLFVTQAWLNTTRGQSLGKLVFGARVVRAGVAPSFVTHVLRRSWLLALPPLVVGLALARPLSPRAFFAVLVTVPAFVTVGLSLIANALPLLGDQRRYMLDVLAGTKLVAAPPWSRPGSEVVVRAGWVLAIAALLIGGYVLGLHLELDLFIY